MVTRRGDAAMRCQHARARCTGKRGRAACAPQAADESDGGDADKAADIITMAAAHDYMPMRWHSLPRQDACRCHASYRADFAAQA